MRWKEIFADAFNKPEWLFKSDPKLSENQVIGVGEKTDGSWLVGVKGSPGRYSLTPIPMDEYRQEEGVIKGELHSSDLGFIKTRDGWEDVTIEGQFWADRPGIHSTSFDMHDTKDREVVGRGHLYKRVIAKEKSFN